MSCLARDVHAIRRSAADPPGDFHALTEVGPDFFTTLGIRIVPGREFTSADEGKPVV
jgi:hypothetical protein